MSRLGWMLLPMLFGMACANERPQRAPGMDPSNVDAPAGQVPVPNALKVAPEEEVVAAEENAPPQGHDHGAMNSAGTDAGGGEHSQHAAQSPTEGAEYSCPMHPEVRQNTPGRCPKCGMKLVLEATDAGAATPTGRSGSSATPLKKKQASTVYTCPMHPEVQQSGPGECPQCGMKLVPRAKTQTGTKAQQDQGAHGGH